MSTPSEPTLPPHSEAFLAEINAQLKQQLDTATKELEYARLKIQVLEERLRLRRIEKYGPSSEKLSSLQLELLEQRARRQSRRGGCRERTPCTTACF